MTDRILHLGPDEFELYLDGRLPPDRTSHLETCPDCSAEVEAIRSLIHQLDALPAVAPSASLADRVMRHVTVSGVGSSHLTGEELDLWTLGLLAQDRQTHLLGCAACRTVADADRVLVRQLEALPRFAPPAHFAERVLDRVDLPVVSLRAAWQLWRRRASTNPLGVAISAGVAVLIGGSVAGSAAWTAGNQEIILGLGHWLRSAGEVWAREGLGLAQAFLDQQPWYGAVRGAMTPGRLATIGLVLAALYAGGVMALRRLIALPEAGIARSTP